MCPHGLHMAHWAIDLATVLIVFAGSTGWLLKEKIRCWFSRGNCDGKCDQ